MGRGGVVAKGRTHLAGSRRLAAPERAGHQAGWATGGAGALVVSGDWDAGRQRRAGGIWFDNYALAQFVGTVALVFILYSGGLFTRWGTVRPILGPGLSLASVGVFITMLATGAFAYWVLDLRWLEALLLGAIVSSTDASAVFGVLRERAVRLRKPLRPLLEFESGTNDPMAVFLTVGLTLLLTQPGMSGWQILPMFVQQMLLGLLLGYGLGRVSVWLCATCGSASMGFMRSSPLP